MWFTHMLLVGANFLMSLGKTFSDFLSTSFWFPGLGSFTPIQFLVNYGLLLIIAIFAVTLVSWAYKVISKAP